MTEGQNPEGERRYEVDLFPQGDGYISIYFNVGTHDSGHLDRLQKMIESAAEIIDSMMIKVSAASNNDEEVQITNLHQLLAVLTESSDFLDQTLARVYYADVDVVEEVAPEAPIQQDGQIARIVSLQEYRSKASGSN